jgi:tetratricopeptide (TPR) repeat protein
VRAAVRAIFFILLAWLACPAALQAGSDDVIRDRWTFIRQHLLHGNLPAALVLLEDLKLYRTEQGIRNLFAEARVLDGMGAAALARDDDLTALKYFDTALGLAPDLPDAHFHRALERLGQFPDETAEGLREVAAGFRALLADPERTVASGMNALFLALAVYLLTVAIFCLFLFFRHIQAATHRLNHFLGMRFHPGALVTVAFTLALLPFLVTASLVLEFAVLLGLALPFVSRRERRWAMFFLVTLALVPAVVVALRTSLVLPDSVAATLYRCERGTCGPEDMDDLGRRAGAALPWWNKVRGDVILRGFSGDPYLFSEAREAYGEALKAQEQDPALWVNFGNLLVAARTYNPSRFGTEVVDQAIMLYDRARGALGDDARVLYNKARAEEARGNAEEAARLAKRALDVGVAEVYEKEREREQRLATPGHRPFNHNVDLFAFVRPPESVYWALWSERPPAPKVANLVMGSLGEWHFLVFWVAWMAALLLSSLLKRKGPRIHACATCGSPICPECTPDFATSETCPVCFYQGIKGRYMEPKEALLYEIRLRRRSRRQALVALLANMAVPGLGHLMRERLFAGFLSFGACGLLLALVHGGLSWTETPQLTSHLLDAPSVVYLWGALAVVWGLSQLGMLRRRSRRAGAVQFESAAPPVAGE